MALVLADRVEQVTRTTGLADLELAEVIRGRQSFEDVTNNGDTVIYVLEDALGEAWEIGVGTVVHGTETTLQRTTIRQSSDNDQKISLSAGTHRVFLAADAQFFDSIVTSAEVAQAIADHEAEADPHSQYTTAAEAAAAAPVQSVNGETGDVSLDASDVGATPSSHVGSGGGQHANATTSTAGFMSAADKTKLDTVESNAKDDQSAAEVPYNNATSGLAATQVQAAIDEVDADLDAYKAALNGDPADGEGATLVNGAPIHVANVAELKTIPASVGWNIKTLGYYTPGDGGGNEYEIVAAATGTDDGGSFIDLDNGRQAKGLFPGEVYAQQFGVKNDVTFDSLDAVKAAVAYGKAVIFENITCAVTYNSYVATSPDPEPIYLSNDATHIIGRNATIQPFNNITSRLEACFVVSASDCVIEGMTFDMPADKYNSGDPNESGRHVTIINASTPQYRNTIKNNSFTGFYRRAVELSTNANNSRVINNNFNSAHGISGYSFNINCAGNDGSIIAGNSIDGGQAGIVLGFATDTTNTLVFNNTVKNVDEVGIDVGNNTSYSLIHGNAVENCLLGGIRYGQAGFPATKGKITNNTVIDSGTSGAPGISANSGDAQTTGGRGSISSTLIDGNTVTGTCSAGVNVSSGVYTIKNNSIEDISVSSGTVGIGILANIDSNYSTIEANEIYRCAVAGIELRTTNAARPNTNCRVRYNGIVDSVVGIKMATANNNHKIIGNTLESSDGAGSLQSTGITLSGNSTLCFFAENRLLGGHTTPWSFEPGTASGYDDQFWGDFNNGDAIGVYVQGTASIAGGSSSVTVPLPSPTLSGAAFRFVDIMPFDDAASADPEFLWYDIDASDANNVVVRRAGTTGSIRFALRCSI